jgi:TonB family protein
VTYTESAVDVPARLLSSSPLSYPGAARAAEFEGEVVVELVVGSEGSVLSARALTAHGLGLETAALSAVRNYRFSAALRQGRPVHVRMRWTVTFRLS